MNAIWLFRHMLAEMSPEHRCSSYQSLHTILLNGTFVIIFMRWAHVWYFIVQYECRIKYLCIQATHLQRLRIRFEVVSSSIRSFCKWIFHMEDGWVALHILEPAIANNSIWDKVTLPNNIFSYFDGAWYHFGRWFFLEPMNGVSGGPRTPQEGQYLLSGLEPSCRVTPMLRSQRPGQM